MKNPPAMQETWVQSPGWEDPLEEGKNTGNPLQYSCPENPIDRGVRLATVQGVARVARDLATKPPPSPSYNQHPSLLTCLNTPSTGKKQQKKKKQLHIAISYQVFSLL